MSNSLESRVKTLEEKVEKLDNWGNWPMKVTEGDFQGDAERIPLLVIVRDILKRLNMKPSFSKGISYTDITKE